MKTSIVILNWNGKEHLEKYLPFVMKHTKLGEVDIVIADNGSTDDSVGFVTANYPQFKVIELKENYGFAGGYNRALKQIDADVYCLLNSDVRVSKGWLKAPLKVFETDNNIVAVQPKILSDRDWSRFEHAGAAGGFIDKYAYPFCRGRIMNAIEYDKGQYNNETDIFWASGACMFIRSKAFHELGGFDDDYFAHMEEIDLCWKLKNRGYRIIYTPFSKVYHFGGATLEYNNPHKLYLNFRNSLWTLYKNYTGKSLKTIMIRRMMIDSAAIIKFLVSFNFKNALAVIKAHIHYYKSKPELRKKRAELMKHVTTPVHCEMYQGSIVKGFFLFKQCTFNDLKKFKNTVIRKSKENGCISC